MPAPKNDTHSGRIDNTSPGMKWHIRFLQLARFVSLWSKDPSTKVGAVITRPNRSICSVGFNGFAQGMPDDEALYNDRDEKLSRIVHAEINAYIFSKEDVTGHSLYTWPCSPCDRCCTQLLQAGIKQFVFPTPDAEFERRWHDALSRSKSYIHESGATYIEVPLQSVPPLV